MKKTKRNIQRTGLILLALVVQILLIIYLSSIEINSFLSNLIIDFLIFFVLIHIINVNENPTFKITWIILIIIFPVFGSVVYVLTSNAPLKKMMGKRLKIINLRSKKILNKKNDLSKEIKNKNIASEFEFLYNEGYPSYNNNELNYYPLGDDVYETMLIELTNAKKYIFLEYFIIKEGQMWDGILKILKKKVKEGVEVRLLYDDIGSIFTLDESYFKELQTYGIKASTFNPLIPIASAVMNNRDHRKMLIIDGQIGFTGGINIADEYININSKYGIWKDNSIMIKGSALESMTCLFLNMWNIAISNKKTNVGDNFMADCEKFIPKHYDIYINKGVIAPYANSPYDKEQVAEKVYLNIINNSTESLYISTPYLIIDYYMTNALILAVKRGVDVHIITPGIPDKKFVNMVTKANYANLISNGVKIYEYTKGFNHSKMFLSDDKIATVGSVNMDYRSLYHHFENGCLLYNGTIIKSIQKDFNELIDESKRISFPNKKQNIFKKLNYAIINLIAPLL